MRTDDDRYDYGYDNDYDRYPDRDDDGGYYDDEKPADGSSPAEEAPAKPAETLEYAGEFKGEYDDDYRAAVLEQIRLAKERRARADKRARDKLHAEIVMIAAAVIVLVLISSVIIHIGRRKRESETFVMDTPDTSSREKLKDVTKTVEKVTPPEPEAEETGPYAGEAKGHKLIQMDGVTYVDGILLVNKTFSLPKDYAPGISAEAEDAFYAMAGAAWADGIGLWQNSGYRSYEDQEALFNSYAEYDGFEEAEKYSSRPGHSEHQTGLSYDVNTANFGFIGTAEAYWLEQHCAEYGFIIRYPQGKEKLTGFDYEPWHIRYVGTELAQKLHSTGQCLEEYLNVTSKYENAADNEEFLKAHPQYTGSASDSSSEAPAEGQDGGYDNGYTDYGYGY